MAGGCPLAIGTMAERASSALGSNLGRLSRAATTSSTTGLEADDPGPTVDPIHGRRLPRACPWFGSRGYSPYAVDWRFLPEEGLFLKDYLRHRLVQLSNRAAAEPSLSGLWIRTLGQGPLQAVRSANRLFIHIPKTAGTSVSSVLYGRNLPHYTATFWASVYGDAVRGAPSFAIVRDPVERLVSAYRMVVDGGTEIMAYSRYWRSRLCGLDSLEAFTDFVLDARSKSRPLPQDMQNQSDFILDPTGRLMVDRLFSLDHRRGLTPHLAKWLGVPDLPHLNRTRAAPVQLHEGVIEKIHHAYGLDFAIYRKVCENGGSADLRGEIFPGGSAPQTIGPPVR